ncbi:hypothetical protein [Xanthomonas phage RTH11]|nr:hypothetical protein [Xanthomonas phage RTH11]
MSRLSQKLHVVHQAAVARVSMESLLQDLDTDTVSLEQQLDEISSLTRLANGLGDVVLSLEAISEPTYDHHHSARMDAVDLLKASGLNGREAANLFPSLEADNPSSGWEKFKAFLKRLWDMVVDGAKKLLALIDNIFKKSTLAEKAAMNRIRQLNVELAKRKDMITRLAQIKLRASHRYVLSNETASPLTYQAVSANITHFKKARDAALKVLPDQVIESGRALGKAIDAINVRVAGSVTAGGTNTPTYTIDSEAMVAAVAPMEGTKLASKLGFDEGVLELIFDRQLVVNEGQGALDTDSYGISLKQNPGVKTDLFDSLEASAFSIADITRTLALAADLIDSGHSADLQRKFGRTKLLSKAMSEVASETLNKVLKLKDLAVDERKAVTFVLRINQSLPQWASVAYGQLNTLNVHVVDSLLDLAADQIKNYGSDETKEEPAKSKDEKKSDDSDKKA